MKKLLSTLGLDSLLPPYSLTSPFSTPHPSRPSSPTTTSRRSSHSRSRSRSRPSSRASTKTSKPTPAPAPTNPDIADLKSTADWEYPASPFTQQQSSPRPLPFREHSSSSIVTIKTPTPPVAGKQGRARSRVRCGIRKGKVDVPVPEIRISSVAGAGPGEGEKEKKIIKGREKDEKGKDADGAILGMNVNQGCVWRYRRHRGVLLSAEGTDYTNVEMWKGLVNAGVTGVKVPTKWELFGDVDATIEIKRLNQIISTAKSYSLGVLLELMHPQPRGSPEGTPDLRSIVMKLYEEVLGRHENIVGVELSREDGAQRREVSFERNLQIWCEVLSGHDMPIYIPVHLDRLGDWMEWIKKMGSGIVLDVLMDSGAQGIKEILKSQGVDWVITAKDQAVREELKKEGIEAWEGFAGCWVAKGDAGFADEELEGIMPREEIIIRAGKVKAELKSSAGREWLEGRGDDREQREAFEEGWEVGFSDAVGFWCNMWEGRAAVGLGLGLGSIHMENGSSVSEGEGGGGVYVGRARIGCLAGWVGKRVRLWMEGKGELEGVGSEVKERVAIGAGEFAEGVRRGVHVFEKQVLKGGY